MHFVGHWPLCPGPAMSSPTLSPPAFTTFYFVPEHTLMAPMIPLGSLAILVVEVRHAGHSSGLEHSWLALSKGLPNTSTAAFQIQRGSHMTLMPPSGGNLDAGRWSVETKTWGC